MSTAQEVIQSAFNKIGRGSEILDIDSTLLAEALNTLKSVMETLRKNEIILEETVSGTTTTIALPSALSDELDEPVAAREHLVNLLAVHLMAASRANPQDVQFVPPIPFSMQELARLYRVHTIPDKVPSRLLPRGQGARRYADRSRFFNGDELDSDVSSTS